MNQEEEEDEEDGEQVEEGRKGKDNREMLLIKNKIQLQNNSKW